MKLFRIIDHKLYHKLDDHEKLCYKHGLPLRYVGASADNLVFVDYMKGSEVPKNIPATRQRKWVEKFLKHISRMDNPGLVVSCYSSPTDTAAFNCAAVLFKGASLAGMTCLCISASRISLDMFGIPNNDLYVIYGITDLPNPAMDRAITSFIYERSGSTIVLVMTGDKRSSPWTMAQNQLRIRLDIPLVLNDESEKNVGTIEV